MTDHKIIIVCLLECIHSLINGLYILYELKNKNPFDAIEIIHISNWGSCSYILFVIFYTCVSH